MNKEALSQVVEGEFPGRVTIIETWPDGRSTLKSVFKEDGSRMWIYAPTESAAMEHYNSMCRLGEVVVYDRDGNPHDHPLAMGRFRRYG